MTSATSLRDVEFCLRKAEEYRAKANETKHRKLKTTFEEAARVYDACAKANAEKESHLK
jgi:hypothetical protein